MSVPRFWRFNRERYALRGVRCPHCNMVMISPRSVCPTCAQGSEAGIPASRIPAPSLMPANVEDRRTDPSITISVIIPAHNTQSTIGQTLTTVTCQEVNVPYEVIVVDSSTDSTPRLVREQFPMVQLLYNETRMQSGAARNLGIQKARGKLIAFTDANCVVSSHWLQQLVDGHVQHPDCAAIGGPIVNGNQEHTLCWAGYLAEFNAHLPVGDTPHEVDHISTGNIAYKRWVFERYGGFPGNEMVEHVALLFNRMLHARGERLLFDPHVVVALLPPISLQEFLVHQRTIGRGTVQAMRRLSEIAGANLVRHRLLAVLSTPTIVMIKFVRNSLRFIRWSFGTTLRHPLLLPLFGLGLAAWGLGFAGEALIGETCEGVWHENRSGLWA
jgi:glycosyltransferase involved in cell wall biosynthesis